MKLVIIYTRIETNIKNIVHWYDTNKIKRKITRKFSLNIVKHKIINYNNIMIKNRIKYAY